MPRLSPLVLVTLVASVVGRPLRAQDSRELLPVAGWEIPGFDIRPDGGWRVKGRAVASTRARLLAQRSFALLNAPSAPGAASPTTVTGVLEVPAILFRYQDSPATQYARDTAQYNATYFATAPTLGRPYTLRSFYEQLSNGLFSMQGQSFGFVALTGTESAYTGAAGTCPQNPFGTGNCNGLFSNTAFVQMQNGLTEALSLADPTVNFGLFDNDGPDDIPNSGDDDGVVDGVLFLHASMDGACLTQTNNHLWSHRSFLFYQTNDDRSGGGKITVRDYILQSGLGSVSGGVCDSSAIAPIGTAAHELGHLLALPDLYDVSGVTQGIGEWGLMSSGNYAKPQSPSRYEAWSLQQMGWTTIVPLTTTGTYSVGPEPTADTVFFVDVAPPNTRPEHFLIENRQAVQSDSAMIRLHGGGGLMIWHVDDEKACLIDVCPNNTNAGSIHGVALQEADGQRQLWCELNGCNRGDGGDPYPGTSGNSAFSFSTTPAATKNLDTAFVGFAIDSIRQVVPNGAMAFRLRFGGVTTVLANDTAAAVLVDGAPYHFYQNLFDDGSTHTIAVTDSQTPGTGRTRYTWASWSDGGAISHQVTGVLAGATYTATMDRAHRLNVVVGANGTVDFNPAADTNGTYVLEGTPVTLTATPTAPAVFGGWTGDTVTSNLVLTLPMGRPYQLIAHFDPQLAITSGDPRPGGIIGKPYADTLRASGGSGSFSWQLIGGALPPGLSISVNGRVAGIPLQGGSSSFTARVTSGAQQAQQTYGLTVTAPTLVKASVVAQVLSGAGLTIDEIRYVDLIGNNNCGAAVTPSCFDVGDFLAWVQATGATPVSPATSPPVVAGKGGRP